MRGPRSGATRDPNGSKVRARHGGVVSAIDPDRNTIDVNVRRDLLPSMRGSWRAFGVLGLQNPEGGSWFDGSEEIHDLAFVGNEAHVLWQDARQGDILAGPRVPNNDGLSSTNAAAVIDWSKVARHKTELADATSPGFHTYLYKSKLDLPEGRTNPNPAVSTQHEYLGPYQPYLVFIPEATAGGQPDDGLAARREQQPPAVDLRGRASTWARRGRGARTGTSSRCSRKTHMINAALPATIQISVLGTRRDARATAASVRSTCSRPPTTRSRGCGIDPDRVTISGASMGGIGTYRLGHPLPDRWAVGDPRDRFRRSDAAAVPEPAQRPRPPAERTARQRRTRAAVRAGRGDARRARLRPQVLPRQRSRPRDPRLLRMRVRDDRDSRRSATRTRTRSCTASIRPSSRRTRRATSRSGTTPRTGCRASGSTARRRAR